MAKGDHICVNRGLYWHHGIDLGNGRVIHYAGRPKGKKDAVVKVESIQKFANGGEIYYEDSKVQYSPDEIVRRAKSRIGEKDYHLVGNNCEQFVNWCRTGQHESQQVNEKIMEAVGASLWNPSTLLVASYAYLKQKFGAPTPPTPQKADGSKYNADYYRKKRMMQRRIKGST